MIEITVEIPAYQKLLAIAEEKRQSVFSAQNALATARENLRQAQEECAMATNAATIKRNQLIRWGFIVVEKIPQEEEAMA